MGVVRRAIVNHNQLKVRVRLGQNALDGLQDDSGAVVRRNDYAEQGIGSSHVPPTGRRAVICWASEDGSWGSCFGRRATHSPQPSRGTHAASL